VRWAKSGFGEVAEWLKAPLSKSGIPFTRDRGFESHPLRHYFRPFERLDRNGALMAQRRMPLLKCGEMSELAEGARLEIVCVAYNGTEGSNPSLSAIFLPAHRLIILTF
jgi:hypothetical protein